jgi:hypothetical protein
MSARRKLICLRVLSDLHREIEPETTADGIRDDIPCDVVVLAGDIAAGIDGIEWAAGTFNRSVVYCWATMNTTAIASTRCSHARTHAERTHYVFTCSSVTRSPSMAYVFSVVPSGWGWIPGGVAGSDDLIEV